MLLPALILFLLFLLLSAFFSSAETAFIATDHIKLDYLSRGGSKNAQQVKKLLLRVDRLLATILIGNTLVNTAAASVATFFFVSILPEKNNQAVLYATVVTTLLILIFSEINPKTYAAYNPLKLSFLFLRPLRIFIRLFYPMVKAMTFLTGLIFPAHKRQNGLKPSLNAEEVKVLLSSKVKGLSDLRSKMISGVLDIGSRPVREIMVPRPQVMAIDCQASVDQVLKIIRSTEFSRLPVFRERVDNIEGIIHAKDLIPFLIDKNEFSLKDLLRKPFFVPESASLESVLLQMQASANQLVFVVDEFGNMEGIVTLEDIIEELVGEIEDEYDAQTEELIRQLDQDTYSAKGNTPIKYINERIRLALPEKSDYTTIAGFFLHEFGHIPRKDDRLDYGGNIYIVDKMKKHQICRLVLKLSRNKAAPVNEGNSQE